MVQLRDWWGIAKVRLHVRVIASAVVDLCVHERAGAV